MQTLTPLSTKAVQQARMRNAVKLIRTKYEDEIAAALQPFFRKQALSAAKSHRGEGQFRAEDWDEELINTIAPLLGKIFAKEMRKQVMEAVDVVSAKASHKLHFMKVFCPTGAGGGVDATCKPGGSGGGATGGGKLSGEGVKIAEKHKDDQAWKEPITEMMEAHGLKYEDYETVNDALYRHNIASGDASDKRLTDLWNGSSDASKAMKVMSAWNEWQTESKKWDPMDPEIAENVNKRLQFVKTDEDWKARQPFFTDGGYFKSADDYRKYLDDRVKGKRIYYRAGPLDKKAVSVTTDPEGARSGASSTHFIPDRLFTYEDMKSKGYRLLAGARGMVGVVSSKEREHILLKIDKNESKGYESRFETKSTASDYLSTFDTNALEENVFQTPMGNVSFDFVSEYPEWMKQDIVDYLHESFGEEYWLDINKTSAGTVDKILELGTQEGWSVNKVAREIVQQAGSPKFTLQRGKMIARTEMGHALNSARVRGMDAFMEQIGKELPMKKTWLSVLGTTTRDSHAHLDGVPANEKGVWEIAGVEARWPSDSRLPAGERINCQCTVVIDYGMTDEMAQAELADYFERIEEKAFKAAIKVFCPTGAGGGVDSSCKPGGGGRGQKTTKAGEVLHAASRGADKVWRTADGKSAPPHIQKLGIPPAWNDVSVNFNPKGNVLAQGVDAKGRGQSRYSANHTMQAAANKFGRVSELRQKRKQIFAEIEKDLGSAGDRIKEDALCTKLIMKTGMRPGSKKDTKSEYQSYGAVTLEGRHIIKKDDGKVVVRFVPGKKKGQTIEMPINDKKLATQLLDKSAKVKADEKIFNTSASRVRAYSKTKDGGGFKTKDHRTALGTEVAIEKIKSIPVPKTKKAYKTRIKEVSEAVSSVLGNTPAIAFKSYIDPQVWAKWNKVVE